MFAKNTCNKIITVVLLMFFLATSAGCSRFASPMGKLDMSLYSPEGTIVAEGQYVIGVRDELRIAVWRCPELERIAIVRPEDGRVTMPLIGEVKAAGLTPKELAQSISDRMKHYVKEPKVAVGVQKFGDKKVFLLGQVMKQGTFRLERGDRMIDLIARAGGFSDNAVKSTSYVIRGGYADHRIVRVNLARLIHKGDVTQNIYLEEGDIIYIPMSELENLNYALRKIFPSMFFAEKLADIQQDIMMGQWDWHAVWMKMAGKD
ncbi:polysaccharide biosynthesis/export family protein [Candidatus Omnitrophota bacterium]